MAYENFIPTVWAEAINRELEKALVYAEGCNRQYDGEVKAMGDTVRILGVGRPTITTTTDKAITLSAPESVEDSSVTLAVRQISYFNYKVDDIDKRQAVGGVMEALNKEATYGLADEMDKHIAGMAATREAVKYAASATAITKDNVLGEIDKALEKLYGNNVRPNGKIMMEVPPRVRPTWAPIRSAPAAAMALASSSLKAYTAVKISRLLQFSTSLTSSG